MNDRLWSLNFVQPRMMSCSMGSCYTSKFRQLLFPCHAEAELFPHMKSIKLMSGKGREGHPLH